MEAAYRDNLSEIDLPTIVANHYPESGAKAGQAGKIIATWRGEENASFSLFRANNGMWLWRDHGTDESGNALSFLTKIAGYDKQQAFEVLKRYGYHSEEKYSRQAKQKNSMLQIVAEYDYCDEAGNLLFQCIRFEPKAFRQRQRLDDGSWKWSLKGCRLVPYRLPQLLRAVEAGEPVCVVEGEKDVHALEHLGFTATCCPMGAGKWRDAYSEYLRSAEVIVLPDNDTAGEKHAQKVLNSLAPVAASLKYLRLPELVDKGDVSDWIASGGSADALRLLISTEKPWQPSSPPKEPESSVAEDSIVETPQGYAILRRGRLERLTNWILEPHVQLCWPNNRLGERFTFVRGDFHCYVELESSVWNSRHSLLEAIGSYGGVLFSSSNSDVARIRDYLLQSEAYQHLPVATGVRSYGLHWHKNHWVSLYEESKSSELFFAGTPVDPGSRAHRSPRDTSDKELEAAKHAISALPKLITASAALAMLGYSVASAFSPRITPSLGNRLPFLYIAGERESGKTSFAQIVLELATSRTARLHSSSSMSRYQYDLACSNCNNLLTLLDEYRPGEIDEAQLRKHHDLSTKWRGSGLVARDYAYVLNSPLIVLGEGFADDPAALSRGALYFVEKKDRGSLEDYSRISQAPFWAYSGHLHRLARELPEAEHQNNLTKTEELVEEATQGKGGPRLTYALRYIAYGLLTLQADINAQLFRDAVIVQALKWGVSNMLEGGEEGMTNIERWLEQLASVLISFQHPEAIVVPGLVEEEIIIRISAAVEAVNQRYGKQAAIANTRMLRRHTKHLDWIYESATHRDFESNPVRGLRVMLHTVPMRCDVEGLRWIERRLRIN